MNKSALQTPNVQTPARVLLLVRPATGGLRVHIIELLRRLDRKHFEPWLCAPANFTDEFPIGLLPYRGAICPVSSRMSPIDLLAILRLRRILRSATRSAPALVHAHGIRAAWIAALAQPLRRHPLIVTLHNVPPAGPIGALVIRVLARSAARIICVSKAIAGAVKAPQSVVIPNGVDLDRYDDLDRDEARRTLEIDPRRFVVAAVARLSHEKGIDVLARAARELPDVEFIVAGDGPDRQAIEQLAPANMHLFGLVESILPILAASDVVVVPSRSEGQGIIALEALASARAVIASNVGGLPEMIRDETGLLVPPGDAEALAGAIARLRDDPAQRERLAKNGREFSKTFGDADQRTREIEAVYAQVLPHTALSKRA